MDFKINTFKGLEGDEVSFSPERGGIITSLRLRGTEILYMDEVTLNDPALSVKGGIPIMFPNAGAIEHEKFPNLKQHGFARNSAKWGVRIVQSNFSETLLSDDESIGLYPYKFRLSICGAFMDKGFSLYQLATNLEESQAMPISMGLHPYFQIPKNEKRNIKFNFKGSASIEESYEKWANGEAISIDNPNEPMEVVIPNLGTLILNASSNYKKIWVWSMPNKDFICIEPVMRDKGGLVENPELVDPGSTQTASLSIFLKKE